MEQKRMFKGAFWAFFIDMFDVYLPLVVLAPAMEYFIPKTLSTAELSTIYFIMFTATLIGRPVGTTIFGHYADKIGRKKVGEISITGFSIVTLLIVLVPDFKSWGYATVLLFILLRFIDGIFLGGGYTGMVPLAIENAPKDKRGVWGSIIIGAYPIAFVIISLITLVAIKSFPKDAYYMYGWKSVFIIGVIIGFVLVYYIRKFIPESIIWQKKVASTSEKKQPLKELFKGSNFKILVQIWILMLGLWFQIMAVAGTMNIVFIKHLRLPKELATSITLVAYFFTFFAYVFAGWWSQKIGRRKAFAILGLLIATIVPASYYMIISKSYNSTLNLYILSIVVVAVSSMAWGIVPSYINERFKTSVRASAYGLGFTLSILIASFYSFYMLALKALVPYEYTQLVLLVVAGFLVVLGALMGPETKDVEME
ncbi:MAG: MFS transporter [Caldisphaera sp.]